MGAQAEERGDARAAARRRVGRCGSAPRREAAAQRRSGEARMSIAARRAAGRRRLRALLGFIAPWWRRLGVVIVRRHLPRRRFYRRRRVRRAGRRRGEDRHPVRLLLVLLPSWRRSPGCCTGSNPGWRTTWPIAAGRDAHRAVPQARRAGAGLSVAAPLRRPGRAGDAGRRDGRVFLRPHRRAGDRRGAGAGRGAGRARG